MNTTVFVKYPLLATLLSAVVFSAACTSKSKTAAPDERGDILVNNVRLYSAFRASRLVTYAGDGSVTAIETRAFEPDKDIETATLEFFPGTPDAITVSRLNSFNKRGQFISAETYPNQFDRPGEDRSSVFTYEYAGEQISSETADLRVNRVTREASEVSFQFDDLGRVIEATQHALPGRLVNWTATRTYNDTGWTTVKVENEFTTTRVVVLNESGRVIQTDVEVLKNGVLNESLRFEYQYDASENLIQTSLFNGDGELITRTELSGYTDVGSYYHDSLQLTIAFDLGSNA